MSGSVDDFREWMQQSEAELSAQRKYAQREIEQAVVRATMATMLQGVSLDDAGDMMIRAFGRGSSDGIHYTPDAVRSVLLAMGWQPKRARSNRGAA